MKYKLYYQINGKKFQEIVECSTVTLARERIRNKIQFDKIDIVKETSYNNNVVESLKNMFGMK